MNKQTILNNFKARSRLIAILICVFFSIFITGAILTYSHTDRSFNRVSDSSINNIFGTAGSHISDPLLQFLGLSPLIMALSLFIISLKLVFSEKKQNLIIKAVFLVVALFSASMFLSLKDAPENWPFYVGLGGFTGDYLNSLYFDENYTILYFWITLSILILSFFFSIGLKISDFKKIICAIKSFLLNIKDYSEYILEYIVDKKNYIISKIRKNDNESDDSDESDYLEQDIDFEIEESKPFSNPKKTKKQRKLKEPVFCENFSIPSVDLLTSAPIEKNKSYNQKILKQTGLMLKKVLEDFGVKGDIVKVRPGPVVILYELVPAAGTKSSRVIGLADDIARSMSAVSARISVIPGRNALGIELPNENRETVYLRELIEREDYKDNKIKLPIALGKDIGGESVMADLSRMPHLLIAGTTGSGKSVAVNAMILSYLYRLSPDECKFIMIDPKMLELSVYEGIPHLLSPVVTEPKKAVVALKWAVREMEDRYRLMSNLGVRNVTGYNKKIEESIEKDITLERTVQTGFDPQTGEPTFEKQPIEKKRLPFIVIIVDEMADLMLTAGKDIEASIQRLAQMARAAGIHMVMATQRPSVDVITGVIKANFPTRISFQVTSRIDSRTILGEMGAEQLLGMGDMLYMSGGSRVIRVHGPFVDDKEVEKVVDHLKQQGKPSYVEDITKEDAQSDEPGMESSGDDLYDKAVAIVIRDKKASTSYVQRQLKIGYNRAANLIDKMEQEGVISEANHVGKRQILVT